MPLSIPESHTPCTQRGCESHQVPPALWPSLIRTMVYQEGTLPSTQVLKPKSIVVLASSLFLPHAGADRLWGNSICLSSSRVCFDAAPPTPSCLCSPHSHPTLQLNYTMTLASTVSHPLAAEPSEKFSQ